MKKGNINKSIAKYILEMIVVLVLVANCYVGLKSNNLQSSASLAKYYAAGNKEAIVNYERNEDADNIMLLSNATLIEDGDITIQNPNEVSMKAVIKVYIEKKSNIDVEKLVISVDGLSNAKNDIKVTNNYYIINTKSIFLKPNEQEKFNIKFYYDGEYSENFNYLLQVESY